MAIEKSIKQIKKTATIRFTGGLDENSPVTALPASKLVTMENWRVAEDGMSIEKVNGVAEVSGVNAAIGAKDVYGYSTFWDSDSNFCQLLVTDEKIWRKIGAGAWTAIHTWSSTLTHPVRIHEVQDKIIVCSEVQNRMILENGAGADVQLGITAPATVPTLAAAVQSGSTDPIDDSMNYANQGAMDAVWTDGDNGATSITSTSNPDSKAGPDADAKYMRFYDASPGTGRYARRYRTVALPPEYIIDFDVYFDVLGYYPQRGHFEIKIYNGTFLFEIHFAETYVWVHNGVEYTFLDWKPPKNDITNRWWNFKIDVKAKQIKLYVGGVDSATLDINRPDTTNSGLVQLTQYTGNTTYGDGDTYIDHFRIIGKGSSEVTGDVATYRYAVSYARNTGNYPGESNPIKSIVGAATIVGAGLNDLTSGGTYTGDVDRTFRVRVDGTGATDTIEWSDDAGETWKSTDLPMSTKMYLGWGVEINFVATTGHTATNYWTIACKAIAIAAASRQITLGSIPTSSDAQVTQRRIYRTTANGTRYYLLAIINDNTTTSFVDNIPDSMLGADEMDEDNDIAPLGKYSEWWDDRLWIYDSDENIEYYSKTNKPDQFDESARYVSLRRGRVNDEGTGMIPYQGHMFVFKHDSVFLLRKQQGGFYGRYEVEGANGCIAPWSLLEVNGLLTWVSYRGWEVFNGQSSYIPEFTLPVVNTLLTIDKANAAFIMACQLRSKFEVMLSVPDRTGGNSAVTVIFNVKAGTFSTRTFSKVPSCLVESRDSAKELQTYMGTRDGYLGTVNSGTQSFGASITATGRTGWIDFGEEARIRKIHLEYEGPDSGSITMATYADFQVTAKNTHTWTTYSPDTATDRSIRLPIMNEVKLNIPGRYFAFKFTNSANVGSEIKINTLQVTYFVDRPRLEKKGD